MKPALWMLALVLTVSLRAECGKAPALELRDLHPTQFAVGYRAVDEKQRQFDRLSNKAAEKYLKDHPIETIHGPANEIFVVDRHHLALALLHLGRDKACEKVLYDWSKLDAPAFAAKMQKENLVYLLDERGRARTYEELPDELTDLVDDPYRSLAYFVREAGGYRKTSMLYAEFAWAEYFRKRLALSLLESDFKRAVEEGRQLARSADAKGMPGYKK